MVDKQIEARGVRDPRVLEAMRRVPRHLFVPDSLEAVAHEYPNMVRMVLTGYPDIQAIIQAINAELVEPYDS